MDDIIVNNEKSGCHIDIIAGPVLPTGLSGYLVRPEFSESFNPHGKEFNHWLQILVPLSSESFAD